MVDKDFGSAAVYKGLAIFDPGHSDAVLYATNFRAGTVEAYDPNFDAPASVTGNFTDPNLPKGYAPFNDKVINGELYVTYAKQDADKHDDEAGVGNGFVDIFNLDGTLKERLISRGALDSPWGLQIAPSSFGSFAGDLLVGNFGNGMINAYNPTTGAFAGTLDGRDGSPLVIDGLWGLTTGNGSAAGGSLDTLFFTAGPNGESDGLFGSLRGARAIDLGDATARLCWSRLRWLSSLAQERRSRSVGTISPIKRGSSRAGLSCFGYASTRAPRRQHLVSIRSSWSCAKRQSKRAPPRADLFPK